MHSAHVSFRGPKSVRGFNAIIARFQWRATCEDCAWHGAWRTAQGQADGDARAHEYAHADHGAA